MKKLKNQIKSFFNFNKRQEQGAFVLIVLIIIAFAVDLVLPKIIKPEIYDYTSTIAEIEAWKATAVKIESKESSNINKSKNYKPEIIRLKPFIFNPNKLPEEKWSEMGMPARIVKTIHNYEAKGGSFKQAKDFQKIYGVTAEIYAQLEEFILIPKVEMLIEKPVSIVDSVVKEDVVIIPLDINRVDSIALLQVPGIGPFYAGHIVDYRNRLGGYISLNQMNELYKMDSSRLNKFLPYLTIKDTMLSQIDLNSAEFKAVLRHPYIDYETTKRILNHRNKLGRYAALYQLQKDSILSDSLFQKLLPYLKVE